MDKLVDDWNVKTAYDIICNNVSNYNKMTPYEKSSFSAAIYDRIFKLPDSMCFTGYMSMDAFQAKRKNKLTYDHCFSPRTGLHAMLKYNVECLNNIHSFTEEFISLVMKTVGVTKAQNRSVVFQSKDGIYSYPELTLTKYNSFNWIHKNGTRDPKWEKSFPLSDQIPEWFTQFEIDHLIRE